jgi:SAM-dependent methyltransferase
MTEAFYNQLAPYYRLIYSDWDGNSQKQAQDLDGVIREFIGLRPKTILDAACGIGTQCIGLARLGYQVSASDLSSAEVRLAQQEAIRQEVQIDFSVTDMRQVWDHYQRQFDVVIACDNSVPHLLSDWEILTAFKQFYQCVLPGGCCLVTVRDYANMELGGKQKMVPRKVHSTPTGQLVMFDVWDFEGECYTMNTYVIEDNGAAGVNTQVMRGGTYYCVKLPTLEMLFKEAGFQRVFTLRDRFFQPLILALK